MGPLTSVTVEPIWVDIARHRLVGHLGPDLLNPDWDDNDAAIAARRLRERPGVELGLALLDQRIMAGVNV